MRAAHPPACKKASSLPMGSASSDMLRAEPPQIVFHGRDFRLKLDWSTPVPITADIAASLFLSPP